MIETASASSIAHDYMPCEVFQEIPYITDLLPQTAETIIALQHEM